MPKEISKWPRRNGRSARKRQRPMSIDLGLLPMTPAITPGPPPKPFFQNCLGKGWRADGEKGPHPLQGSLAVFRRQAKPWWEERVPPLSWDWPTSAPCQRPLGAATISEIYFGICSRKLGIVTEMQNIVASGRCFTNICGPFNTRALCYPDFFFPKAYHSPCHVPSLASGRLRSLSERFSALRRATTGCGRLQAQFKKVPRPT